MIRQSINFSGFMFTLHLFMLQCLASHMHGRRNICQYKSQKNIDRHHHMLLMALQH
uniref:Uncharacterized protein n=1 Tax=Arundo donax TaxID=35708 RepID=A0A0A9CWM5_ARUDO